MIDEKFFNLKTLYMQASNAVMDYLIGEVNAPFKYFDDEHGFELICDLAGIVLDELNDIGIVFSLENNEIFTDIAYLKAVGSIDLLFNTDIFLHSVCESLKLEQLEDLNNFLSLAMYNTVYPYFFEEFIEKIHEYFPTNANVNNMLILSEYTIVSNAFISRMYKIIDGYMRGLSQDASASTSITGDYDEVHDI